MRVLAKPGDAVIAGQPLLVLEAIEVENEVKARADGTVLTVHVTGATVESNARLLARVARAHDHERAARGRAGGDRQRGERARSRRRAEVGPRATRRGSRRQGLFFHACGLLAAALLASYGLAAMIAQAVIAEWGMSRLGVRWTAERASDARNPLRPPRAPREASRSARAPPR